jgi:hypothetical protein
MAPAASGVLQDEMIGITEPMAGMRTRTGPRPGIPVSKFQVEVISCRSVFVYLSSR